MVLFHFNDTEMFNLKELIIQTFNYPNILLMRLYISQKGKEGRGIAIAVLLNTHRMPTLYLVFTCYLI